MTALELSPGDETAARRLVDRYLIHPAAATWKFTRKKPRGAFGGCFRWRGHGLILTAPAPVLKCPVLKCPVLKCRGDGTQR